MSPIKRPTGSRYVLLTLAANGRRTRSYTKRRDRCQSGEKAWLSDIVCPLNLHVSLVREYLHANALFILYPTHPLKAQVQATPAHPDVSQFEPVKPAGQHRAQNPQASLRGVRAQPE
jgi:hypothetical protein